MSRISDSDLQLALCTACGTQFDDYELPKSCPICDDPRASVPPSGQSWTCLANVHKFHRNLIEPMPGTDGRVHIIRTEPKFAIGQRAFLIRTSSGNILWDLVALLDDDTIHRIDELGGIDAIVISHPHFYTTHLTWSRAFENVPVYLAANDAQWLVRSDLSQLRHFINSPTQEILGATAIKTGGHFPGSMVLLWERRLFVADSVMVTPAGRFDGPRPPGTVAFAFLWAYPNMIPLPSPAILAIVRALDPYDFDSAHAGFDGFDVAHDAKRKMVESARIVLAALDGTMPGELESREFWK